MRRSSTRQRTEDGAVCIRQQTFHSDNADYGTDAPAMLECTQRAIVEPCMTIDGSRMKLFREIFALSIGTLTVALTQTRTGLPLYDGQALWHSETF